MSPDQQASLFRLLADDNSNNHAIHEKFPALSIVIIKNLRDHLGALFLLQDQAEEKPALRYVAGELAA